MNILSRDVMFRGKSLTLFLQRYRQLYADIVAKEGADKVLKVYRYTFNLVSGMRWGQYMKMSRVCPDPDKRQMFFWCLEMIYNSDLLSQMQFTRKDGEEAIEVVVPSVERQQKLAILLGDHRYIYIDWYSRLLQDPKCNSDVRPEWLMLDAVADDQELTLADDPEMESDY